MRSAELVIVGTKSVTKDRLTGLLGPHQIVIDLVNLQKSQRLEAHPGYEGICW